VATRAQYRRALQAALDDSGIHLLSAATSTTASISTISDATTNASANRYDGVWIYVASGAQIGAQRWITPGSFVPSTGTVTVEFGWTAPAANDVIELTSLFPCEAQVAAGSTSYNAIVNKALSRLWAPDRISATFAGGTTASLAAYAYWLDRPERLVRVLEPAPVSGYQPVPCDWRNPQLILDGGTPTLQIDTPYTGTLTLDVMRPGDSLVSGAESTTGPTSETATCLPSLNDVVTVGLEEAYRALMHRSTARPSGNWADKLKDQQALVQQLRYLDRTQAVNQPMREAA
jgi:hypothetical protein